MAKSKKYQDWLIEKLKDHNEAVAYLNAALEESLKGDEESQHLFLLAVRNVAEAHGGMSKLAEKAHLGRESLYKTLDDGRKRSFCKSHYDHEMGSSVCYGNQKASQEIPQDFQ